MTECSECDGTGIVEGPMSHRTGPNPRKTFCPNCMEKCIACNGTGEFLSSWVIDDCEFCNGRGYVPIYVEAIE